MSLYFSVNSRISRISWEFSQFLVIFLAIFSHFNLMLWRGSWTELRISFFEIMSIVYIIYINDYFWLQNFIVFLTMWTVKKGNNYIVILLLSMQISEHNLTTYIVISSVNVCLYRPYLHLSLSCLGVVGGAAGMLKYLNIFKNL